MSILPDMNSSTSLVVYMKSAAALSSFLVAATWILTLQGSIHSRQLRHLQSSWTSCIFLPSSQRHFWCSHRVLLQPLLHGPRLSYEKNGEWFLPPSLGINDSSFLSGEPSRSTSNWITLRRSSVFKASRQEPSHSTLVPSPGTMTMLPCILLWPRRFTSWYAFSIPRSDSC